MLPSRKTNFFNLLCACGHQMCQQPVACECVPFSCLWLWLCHSQLKRSSHSYMSLPSKTTSVFSHFKLPCQSEKLKVSSRVINLVPKNTHQTFQCSMLSAAPASWDFCVAHGRMYDIKRRINWKHHINREKAIGSTLNISYFVGWNTVFTAFGCNLSRDAFHKFLCSAHHHCLCSWSC